MISMDWTGDGQVSYWADGAKITGPKPYTDDEFLALTWQSRKDGSKSLWVEGFQGVSRAALNLVQAINPRTTGVQDQNSYRVIFWLRIPRENKSKTPKHLADAGPWARELDGNYAEGAHYAFLDDTGAVVPTICKTDLKQLIRKSGGLQPPTIAWFPINQVASAESPVLKLMLVEAVLVGPRVKRHNGTDGEHRAPMSKMVLLPIFETTEKNVSGR
ncbi:hypothetical protein VI817_000821 [Penicillium citrinum]|nr:hypothetical protein VI817_000821 [Penicillium citrinum]